MRTNIQLDDALVEEAFRAKRRRNQVRNGTVQPIPGGDALAQVRRLLEYL